MKPSPRAGDGSARFTVDGERTIDLMRGPSRIGPATLPAPDIERASRSPLRAQAGFA